MPPNSIGGFMPHFDPITGFPLAARFNIPEVFGQAISYNDQIMILGRWIAAFKREMETFLCFADGEIKQIAVLRAEFDELRETVDAKFLEIDTRLDLIDIEIIAINNTLGDHASHLAIIDGHIISINNALTLINGRLDDIDTMLSNHGGRITALETDVAGIHTTIAGMQGAIGDLQTTIPGLEGDITALTVTINNVQTTLTTIQGNIADLQTAANVINATIDGILTDMTALDGRVTTLEGLIPLVESFTLTSVSPDIQINNSKGKRYGRVVEIYVSLQFIAAKQLFNVGGLVNIPEEYRPQNTVNLDGNLGWGGGTGVGGLFSGTLYGKTSGSSAGDVNMQHGKTATDAYITTQGVSFRFLYIQD